MFKARFEVAPVYPMIVGSVYRRFSCDTATATHSRVAKAKAAP